MSHDRSDLTRPPDLSHERRTGPMLIQRPIYVDLLPPCNHACPAGENIQAWLGLAQGGRFEEAWRTLVANKDTEITRLEHRFECHGDLAGALKTMR